MCSAPQLVNCQYEPPLESEITEDTIDSTSTLTSNTICNDYAPGTHLPIANRFDAFIICENDGKSTLIQCKPGLRYNALTTNCEIKPCEVNSALCKNNGHCIDEPTDIKGFQCICSDGYQGEYCDQPVEIIATMDTTTLDQPQLTNPPPELVTSTPMIMTNDDFVPKSISYSDLHNDEKNNVIEDLSTINSPFTRIFHRLNNKVDHQQQLTEIIQIVFITVMTLIGLILLGSIIFGITVCIHYDYYHRRKSEKSECTQNGIYPDVLDCSLFHYCHQNKQHEIFKCPDGLHFDPKIFMCSAPQLVNCQYEPPLEAEITEDTIDSTSTLTSNTICNDYAPGTHLPIANRFDAFIICENDGKSTLIQCKPGLRYNALTTNCEIKPCAVNSALCKNNGHCIDEPTDIKGFQCICSDGYQGEYCDQPVEIIETITNTIDTTTLNQPQLTNPPPELVTSTIPAMTNDDFVPKSISFNDLHNNEKNNVIEDLSTINSPFTRIFHRLNNKVDHQQQLTEIIQIVFITVMTLIGLILLGSIIFGITVCIRMIISRSVDNVGTWKILTEESKV
ncbi:unnamed protein product [Adineta steineri]|uniref:Uncharacterized protein n=1 Tax=Adineta steineri TaxID=433720 RepID=A0A815SRI0_9BILA|nr:unnamed protein product [Adineta steineri]